MASGLMWFASFGLSGLGMQMMGKLGVSVGWSMLLGFALVTSTLWSAAMGEWRGKGRAAGWMVAGVIVVIGAICLLGYANSLS
jgi:L-rhamnose-H+ transport protein